ncbi:MAG: RNA polymerase sigma factor RpoD/SigA [Deltaproteobacteria bacterium]|nr:RNA polymerase sigma factor RpoD/SigA [Deltaproteobacteria bacterium]
MVAAKKTLIQGPPVRVLRPVPALPAERRNVGPRADPLDSYLEGLARIPLFTPAEERQAAKTLRELELEAWRRALPFRATLETIGSHEKILELTDRASLEEVARQAGRIPMDWPPSHPLAKDLAHLGEQLREVDEDQELIDGATARLLAMARESQEGRRRPVIRPGQPTLQQALAVDRARRAAVTARNAFVRANLRLVVSVARGFHHFRLPLIDLIQEGNLGLIKAVHRFDWKKGFRFSTYAHWWIRQSIERAIMNKGAQVRLPVHVFDTRRQLARANKELSHALGRKPSEEEIAEHLGIPMDKLQEVLHAAPREPVSLDEPVGAEDDRKLGEVVADESVEPPDDWVIRDDEVTRVRQLLKLLTPVEMDIIQRRFGLAADQDETLEEIGRKYNLSRERVRQIQVQGLEKMRRFCERRNIGTDG